MHIKRLNFEYKGVLISKNISYFNSLASLESEHRIKVKYNKFNLYLILILWLSNFDNKF